MVLRGPLAGVVDSSLNVDVKATRKDSRCGYGGNWKRIHVEVGETDDDA
jgi:hypothetical protein